MIRTVTGTFTGEAQIHAEGYRQTLEVENTIRRLEQVTDGLRQEQAVGRFTPRAMSQGDDQLPCKPERRPPGGGAAGYRAGYLTDR